MVSVGNGLERCMRSFGGRKTENESIHDTCNNNNINVVFLWSVTLLFKSTAVYIGIKFGVLIGFMSKTTSTSVIFLNSHLFKFQISLQICNFHSRPIVTFTYFGPRSRVSQVYWIRPASLLLGPLNLRENESLIIIKNRLIIVILISRMF